ncbi:MAG: GAF domain-containing protein [Acidobacteria bacterium]|jgi:signal transduction histidine kinase|nr:GAF domain-containing protein [Acidobacteriota bacterium]
MIRRTVAKDLPKKTTRTQRRPTTRKQKRPSPRDTELRRLQAAVAMRERELAILADITRRLHGQEEVQVILDQTLDGLVDGLGLDTAWILLEDPKDGGLRLAAHRGVSPAYLDTVARNGLDRCLCPEVFSSGHRAMARNTTDCPRMPTIGAGLEQPVAHACVPLAFNGKSHGVLNVAAPPGQVFADEQLRFLDTVGRQVCLAVEGARHLKAQRRRDQEARALAALNKGIGESLEPEAVLEAVGRTALEVLRVDRIHILLGSDARRLTVAHLAGLPHPELSKGQTLDLTALGGSLHRRALEEQRWFVVEDEARDDRVNKDLARRWAGTSGVILPLVARGVSLGLLVITSAAPKAWREDQVELAEALASQASVALENARLYDKARRAYRELNEAQARIIHNEKMAVVGTFASGLAHEVRNPLNSIALQLSILERRVAPLPSGVAGEIRELVGVIRQEVRRLDNLVGDFLQFSRSNRIQYRPASLDALLDEVMRLLRPEARAAGVALRRQRFGAPVPDLRVDPEKIKQVAINLVQNAIEALHEGGEVAVESGLVDGQALMRIRDDGPGLPEGLDVFQLFVTTKAEGTGLGLSIAQQIVLEHGGEIAADSEPGQGTTITVGLPVERPETSAAGEEP